MVPTAHASLLYFMVIHSHIRIHVAISTKVNTILELYLVDLQMLEKKPCIQG